MQCQSGPLGAACPYSAGYYKAKGRYDRQPRVGDQVFYQENGSLSHTGIVVAVTDTLITTVEGNAGNMVQKKTRRRADSYIDGYGHPDYAGSGGASAGQAPAPVDKAAMVGKWQSWLGVQADGAYGENTRQAALVRALRGLLERHPLKTGEKGGAVQVLQGRLYSLGYDPGGLDGEYGAATAAAVRIFQTAAGLKADGAAGEATFAALFGL